MSFQLKNVLQALLFACSDPLSVKNVQDVIKRFHEEKSKDDKRREAPGAAEAESLVEVSAEDWPEDVPALITTTRIRETIAEIRQDLAAGDSVWDIQETQHGYRLVVRPAHALWVKLLRDEPREIKLSQAALETLAVVAYRQPATKAEIETIRGVSVDGAINRLLERDLVMIKGRADLPGRPIQYGTTDAFLDFVGLRSLEELPSSDVLSPREVDAWIVRASKSTNMTDRDMGLPDDPPSVPTSP